MKRILVLLVAALLILFASDAPAAAKSGGNQLLAASDGKGSVSLVWMPVDNAWPRGGWRLERIAGGRTTVVAEKLGPGLSEAALSRLDAKESAGIREFAAKLGGGTLSVDDAKKASFVFALAAAVDQSYGEALGLRYVDKVTERGSVRYRLLALGGGSRAGAVESGSVDPWTATPPPAALEGVKAVQDDAAVILSWPKPRAGGDSRIISYSIERATPSAERTVLTKRPLLIAQNKDAKAPTELLTFSDRNPVQETQNIYYVSGVDAFLRKTPSVKAELLVKDLRALAPPSAITAKPGRNEAELQWKVNPSQFNAGYIIERGQMAPGPYETLNQQAIPRTVERYQDKGLYGGSKFFYRIRSVNARGEVGTPSEPVAVQPVNAVAPPPPDGVAADAGRTRIRLTWNAVPFPVAGYFIERRIEGAVRWERLNESLVQETMYDDITGATPGVRVRYRIIAVAFDNQESRASSETQVELADLVPPATPNITGISGQGGKAVILFAPALPEDKTHQFLLLRAGTARELGIVIGDPLPGSSRTFTDEHVEAGKTYWYRLVSVDRSGNRSDPTHPVPVVVGTPPIPKAAKPSVSRQTTPFAHNKIIFEAAPEGLLSIVQSRAGASGDWKNISGPSRGETEVADPEPPVQQTLYYRIIYQAPNGARGEASDSVEVKR